MRLTLNESGFTACGGRVLILLISLFALHSRASERSPSISEWTRFRGPNGSGISSATGVPVQWSEKDYNWKTTLPAKGHSSPVIWADKIFLTCGEDSTAKRIIVCLDATKGSILWRREYESKTFPLNRDNSYGTSTPAVDQDQVYVYWTTLAEVSLAAFDHNGKEVWKRNLGPFASQHGSGTSPIVYEDLVVLGNDQEGNSSLFALDRKTGATRWQVERRVSRAAYSTPCVYQPDGSPAELIFSSTGHGVTSLNPITGAKNWELQTAFPMRVVSSPVVASGLIIGTCGEGANGTRLVAVRPGSKQNGVEPQLAYDLKAAIPYVPTPVIKNGLMFLLGDNGMVACLRAATGERLWQERLDDHFYSSPVWVNGRLYCVSRPGVVFVIAASEKYELLARNTLGEESFATPAIANETMYLRTFSHLISIGGKREASVAK